MTSPSIPTPPILKPSRRPQSPLRRIGLPVLCFLVTMVTTTAVGMRYMYNFRLGNPPLADDADILPFVWVIHHLSDLSTGLPFSITLIGILLAHEFGHYFACRTYNVRCTLPYLLPAPSLSGTFGAVIRLKSVIRSRAALIMIGASGPIAGFLVALFTVTLGLSLSHYSATTSLLASKVQAPLTIQLIHLVTGGQPLHLIIPHPVLIASWIGLLITALNLVPAGQLDGGHILYAVSPELHRWSTRLVIAGLLALGIFSWVGWIVWGIILCTPGMRHPVVKDTESLPRWQYALIPICLVILLCSGTFQPFEGYSVRGVFRMATEKTTQKSASLSFQGITRKR